MSSVKSPTRVDAVVGQNIRRHRLDAGMPQTRLAELVGVTYQQIQKYEKGASRVGASRLVLIAKALKIQPTALFERVKRSGRSYTPAALLSDGGSVRVLEYFSEIKDPRTRQALVHLLERIVAAEKKAG